MNRDTADKNREQVGPRSSAAARPSETVPPPLPSHCSAPSDGTIIDRAPPRSQTPPNDSPSTTSGLVEICPQGRGPGQRGSGRRRESTVWLSSVGLHSLLVVILWLLLAPADYGGADVLTLAMRLNDADDSEVPLEVMVSTASAPEDAPPLLEEPPIMDLVPIAPNVVANQAGSGAVQSDHRDGNASGESAAARGSFFGIEAQGHEFVYVVDMSGSMRGRRYDRAAAELVRSVSGLRDSQKFYVLLFSDNAVQMFGQSQFRPQAIAATTPNKEKLAQWLRKAYQGGGTNPNDALRVALRMNPSAIFMLSDGKFDKKKKRAARSNVLGGESDAFSIVAAAKTKVPIHTIAFENRESRGNMQRLAEMTDGSYRFASYANGENLQDTIRVALEALDRGDRVTAEFLLRELINGFGDEEADWKHRERLAEALSVSAEHALKGGRPRIAVSALATMAEMDPDGVVSGEIQETLLEDLLAIHSKRVEDGQPTGESTLALLDSVVDRSPESKVAIKMVDPLVDEIYDQAVQLDSDGNQIDAICKLDSTIEKYSQASGVQRCRDELERICQSMLDEAQRLQQRKDDAASAIYLRKSVAKLNHTSVVPRFRSALETLAVNMLTKARNANHQGDRATRDEWNRQINDAFANDSMLSRLRSDFSIKEAQARELLRRGTRLERVSGSQQAVVHYTSIVNRYSGTLAAQKAKERLLELDPSATRKSDQESAQEALERMLTQ